MLSNEMLIKFLSTILERSRINKVIWIQHRSGEFEIVFKDGSKLRLMSVTPKVGGDGFSAALFTPIGYLVRQIFAEEGDPYFDLLRDLYNEAFRSVTKYDITMANLESELSNPDAMIGTPEPQEDPF